VTITIIPDIAASTPAAPLFEKPIYVLDIKQVRIKKKSNEFCDVQDFLTLCKKRAVTEHDAQMGETRDLIEIW
jgi:hypothetical protein